MLFLFYWTLLLPSTLWLTLSRWLASGAQPKSFSSYLWHRTFWTSLSQFSSSSALFPNGVNPGTSSSLPLYPYSLSLTVWRLLNTAWPIIFSTSVVARLMLSSLGKQKLQCPIIDSILRSSGLSQFISLTKKAPRSPRSTDKALVNIPCCLKNKGIKSICHRCPTPLEPVTTDYGKNNNHNILKWH